MATVRNRKARSLGSKPNSHPVAKQILAQAANPVFKKYLLELLVELCRVDTTPSPKVARMREAEGRCFSILERELNQLSFSGQFRRLPINPAIQVHPFYSLLHFTKTPSRPEGLSAKETYAGRSNLVYQLSGSGARPGQSIALNAHLDVVAPYFPPRIRGGVVHGRGACDDKGPVAAIVGALKLLSQVMPASGLEWNRNVLAMFVVEEETGGNGSLSLALDRDLKMQYDSVLVSECTGLKIYPANRGAVWYRAELKAPLNASTLEMAAFVTEELEKEGTSIRAESRHPLFPQRPVQTCHGIIGSFGEHPSRICGQVSFRIRTPHSSNPEIEALVRDCLEFGLAGYVGLYGDKTKVTDPATGKPMVARHYDLRPAPNGYIVDVFGAAGHMGAIRERDGAITKMAHLVRSLVFSKAKLERLAGGPVTLQLDEPGSERKLILEGGQGFVPTHGIDEVMDRMRRAAQNGAEHYFIRTGRALPDTQLVEVKFEKLHNVAFDGDPDSPAMRNAIAAAKVTGLWKNEPVLGWTVSCDARLFASEYPGMPVLTFGPGQLGFAHSDHEQIDINEVCAAARFLAVFLLKQTGTAP